MHPMLAGETAERLLVEMESKIRESNAMELQIAPPPANCRALPQQETSPALHPFQIVR